MRDFYGCITAGGMRWPEQKFGTSELIQTMNRITKHNINHDARLAYDRLLGICKNAAK